MRLYFCVQTHCNTLQHAATGCNKEGHSVSLDPRATARARSFVIRHAATRCNTLQHAATRCNKEGNLSFARQESYLARTFLCFQTRCNKLQQVAQAATRKGTSASLDPRAIACAHSFVFRHAATRCNTLQHAATHCNTPHRCNTLQQ